MTFDCPCCGKDTGIENSIENSAKRFNCQHCHKPLWVFIDEDRGGNFWVDIEEDHP